MAPRQSRATLAFIGPPHTTELTEFCYVRLIRESADQAVVKVVGPDSEDNGQELSLPLSAFELRAVDEAERNLLPGSYLAHPIAFVQQSGPRTGQWAYGVVIRYEVDTQGAWLAAISGEGTVVICLKEPLRVIKAYPLTYSLQVGAKLSDMVLNPKELLRQQDDTISACQQKRGDIPASVMSMLPVPFAPDGHITLVRPHDLVAVSVRRQHVLDCLVGKRKKSATDLYRDPHTAVQDATSAPHLDADSETRHSDDLLSITSGPDEEDLQEVRRLDRTLGKRRRALDPDQQSRRVRLLHTDSDHSTGDEVRRPLRQSSTQRRVAGSIIHPRFQGKFYQYVLERMQQSDNVPFLRLPPICRGLYEFGFLARGLTLMHCRRADLWDQVHAHEGNVNYTDFCERNTLRAAPAAASRSDVCGAPRSLRVFAQEFYVDTVLELIDTALSFVERYQGVAETDAVSWKLTAYWVTSKFGKFRSLVVSRDLAEAQNVNREFSRVDEDLLELLDLRRSQRSSESGSHRHHYNHDTSRRGERQSFSHDSARRNDRNRRQSSVPTTVLEALPRQGDKRLCMKSISVMGCTGDGSGGCFDSRRAHFQPTTLPEVVAAYIKEKYHGLASGPKAQ